MTSKTKGQEDDGAKAPDVEPAPPPATEEDEPAEAAPRPQGDEGRAVREHQARLAEMDKVRGS